MLASKGRWTKASTGGQRMAPGRCVGNWQNLQYRVELALHPVITRRVVTVWPQ